MQMDDLRRIRLFLDLRRVDVEKATAISVLRLSKSESGRITLTRAEKIRLENFLRDRMRVVAEIKRTRTAKAPRPRLLRLKSAAEYLSLSEWTLRRIIQQGGIPVIRTNANAPWLVDIRDLDSWIDRAKETLP